MIGRLRPRALVQERRGNTAVEFALLAPIFLGMMFSIVEGSRFLWVKQSLKEVAFSTARCTSVSADCDTATNRVNYAIARAHSYGQTLGVANVSVAPATTCNASAGMVKVTISMPFNSPVVGLLPGMPSQISAQGCYPALTV